MQLRIRGSILVWGLVLGLTASVGYAGGHKKKTGENRETEPQFTDIATVVLPELAPEDSPPPSESRFAGKGCEESGQIFHALLKEKGLRLLQLKQEIAQLQAAAKEKVRTIQDKERVKREVLPLLRLKKVKDKGVEQTLKVISTYKGLCKKRLAVKCQTEKMKNPAARYCSLAPLAQSLSPGAVIESDLRSGDRTDKGAVGESERDPDAAAREGQAGGAR